MAAVGFAWFLRALAAADDAWLFTLGVLLVNLHVAVFVHMLVSYPDGRIEAGPAARGRRRRLRPLDPRPARGAALPHARTSTATVPAVGDPDRATRPRCSASSTASRRCSPSCWSARSSSSARALPRRPAVAAARDGAGDLVGHRAADRPRRLAGLDQRRAPRRGLGGDVDARPRPLRAVPVRLPLRDPALARPPGGRGDRVPAPDRRRPGPERPARPALERARRPLAGGRLLARPAALGRRHRPSVDAPARGRPGAGRHRVDRDGRGVGAHPARARPLRRPRPAGLRRRRRRPRDRERAPAGPAVRAGRGAARVARPARRGRHRRAPPARAQPARRRPAAARRALAHPPCSRRAACTRTPTTPRR